MSQFHKQNSEYLAILNFSSLDLNLKMFFNNVIKTLKVF